MKILVTGSSGHLGEALMRTLRQTTATVIGLDAQPGPFTDLCASVSDAGAVREAMAGVSQVYHAATLHKPHVATHSQQDFLTTNVLGTLTLLEAAVHAGVTAFVFTSTTSVFGDALRNPPGTPAAWITEQTLPLVKNIYGATKLAAEDLCRHYHCNHALNCIVLRTSRFFFEDDDDKAQRAAYSGANSKANEFLYRRVDIEDVVRAHQCAAERAPQLGHGTYIVSATTPFSEADLTLLGRAPERVVQRLFPDQPRLYQRLGYQMLPHFDRVYVNTAARRDLGWQPHWDYARVLDCLAKDQPTHSALAETIGAKGYHDVEFTDGPYPVN